MNTDPDRNISSSTIPTISPSYNPTTPWGQYTLQSNTTDTTMYTYDADNGGRDIVYKLPMFIIPLSFLILLLIICIASRYCQCQVFESEFDEQTKTEEIDLSSVDRFIERLNIEMVTEPTSELYQSNKKKQSHLTRLFERLKTLKAKP